MTGGGPLNSTLSVSMYVYQQGFSFLNLGYASAIAYALFLAIVVLAVIQFRVLRSEETHEHPRSGTPAPGAGGARGRRARGGAGRRGWLLIVTLMLGLVLTIVPFLWMLLGSLKTQAELLQQPPTFLPENPTTANYERLWDRLDFPRFFWNSTVIALLITLSNLLFCSMVGYALAKLRFVGRDKLFLLVLGTLLVPGAVTARAALRAPLEARAWWTRTGR